MAIIVSESEQIRSFMHEIFDVEMRNLLRELGLLDKNKAGPEAEAEWVSLEEAKLIVPIKSRKKWKELRDYAEVNFAQVGKGFIYEKKSLIKYIVNKSTITQTRKNGKGKK